METDQSNDWWERGGTAMTRYLRKVNYHLQAIYSLKVLFRVSFSRKIGYSGSFATERSRARVK
jgi:hypothetical protein